MTYTAATARMIFGQEMKPCPNCGGYQLKYQTPIRIDLKPEDGAKQILGKWARAIRAGATELQGPCYLMCWDCRHKGPSLDCTGRTSEDVGKDPKVATEVKHLWNTQAQPLLP